MSDTTWYGDAILFDIDGTLIESMSTIERHTIMWAERHGLDGESVLENWHGRRDIDVIAEYIPAHLVETELAWMREISLTDVAGITALPGALELVRSLRPDTWGLVTSGEKAVVTRRLEAAGFPLPRTLVSADDVVNGKPHPEGFRKAARLLGADPRSCIAFEDADSGIEAALAAGMRTVMVGDSASRHEDAWYVSSFKKVAAAPPAGGGTSAMYLNFAE
ncbi:HAD-IA family hydrolase [Streptomyces globisporus]|uniref:HAD-IA family hydrolase n=1 Tax=Streptomyces globisporus TaxID=1908 RepID=UPI0037A6C25E